MPFSRGIHIGRIKTTNPLLLRWEHAPLYHSAPIKLCTCNEGCKKNVAPCKLLITIKFIALASVIIFSIKTSLRYGISDYNNSNHHSCANSTILLQHNCLVHNPGLTTVCLINKYNFIDKHYSCILALPKVPLILLSLYIMSLMVISSVESQNGTNAVQRCSDESQKGAIAMDFVHH